MKSKTLLIIGAVTIVILGGIYILTPSKKENKQTLPENNIQEEAIVREEKQANTNTVQDTQTQKYVDYSPDYLTTYQNQKKVLFFHAAWCPTCKAAEQAFKNNLDKMPENVVVIKTDYDTQSELKKKYGIGYQHTFVYVDNQGNELTKWNGGDIDELIKNIN